MDPDTIINRANQLNPNNWRFWKSRGLLGRPEDWTLFLGEMNIPVLPGLKTLVQKEVLIFTQVAKVVAGTAKTIGTGGAAVGTTLGFLCTFKGTLVLIAFGTAAAMYWKYKSPLQRKIVLEQAVTVCKTAETYVPEKSVIAAKYSAEVAKPQGLKTKTVLEQAVTACKTSEKYVPEKFVIAAKYSAEVAKPQGLKVWHYGVVSPFNATKSGAFKSTLAFIALDAAVAMFTINTTPQQEKTLLDAHKTSRKYEAEKSVIAAMFPAPKAQSPKVLPEKSAIASIWHYGAVVPFNATKSVFYYSGVGVTKAASTLGYYCGITK